MFRCLEKKSDKLYHWAFATAPIVGAYDTIKDLIYPQFWRSCIRVFKHVDIVVPEPIPGTEGKARITETVCPLFPSDFPLMVSTLDLTFRVNEAERWQRVDFTLVAGDELVMNRGFIAVQAVPGNASLSVMSIDKHIEFKSLSYLANKFNQFPGTLAENLTNWLTSAESEAGPL